MKTLVVWSAALASAMAQTPPSESATASVSGVVKSAASHAPLEGVRVYVAGGNGDGETTGPQGRFEIRKLEAGGHYLSAYDRGRAASGGTYVLLKAGEAATGVEIFLKTGGSISGKVWDEDRKPVSGAAVVLLEPVFEFGRTVYSPLLSARTDREGAYKLSPVPAERGFLLLAKTALQPGEPEGGMPADPEKRPRVAAPTFYQDATVTIGAEEERRGADIEMTSAPSYCMEGTVKMASGTPPSSVRVSERLPLISRSSFAPVRIAVHDGKFRACGFHPGEYRLDATGNESPGVQTSGIHRYQMDARAEATIGDRDAEEVQVLPRAALTIEGEATLEGTDRKDVRLRIGLSKMREQAAADELDSGGGMMMSGVTYGDHIQAPGSFRLEQMPPDDYKLEFSELPEGCYVKGAPLDVQLGEGADDRLHVAVACDGASLTARVTDGDGNPVSHLKLYLIPADAASPAALQDDLQQAEIENGWSEVKPLAPGKYLALACDVETDGTAAPIVKLWQARGKAKEIEIGAGQKAQITLESIELR